MGKIKIWNVQFSDSIDVPVSVLAVVNCRFNAYLYSASILVLYVSSTSLVQVTLNPDQSSINRTNTSVEERGEPFSSLQIKGETLPVIQGARLWFQCAAKR